MEAALIAMGGKLWEVPGKRRIYLENIAELYGYDIARYNTGNISSATYLGQPISNTRAYKALGALPDKLWYDCTTGQLMGQRWGGVPYLLQDEHVYAALGLEVPRDD